MQELGQMNTKNNQTPSAINAAVAADRNTIDNNMAKASQTPQ